MTQLNISQRQDSTDGALKTNARCKTKKSHKKGEECSFRVKP